MTKAKYPFNDFSSFIDFVAFVRMCSPDRFPVRDGVPTEYQWSLELAFEGLRIGLDDAERNNYDSEAINKCRRLFQDSYMFYKESDRVNGFKSMEQAQRYLKSAKRK